VLKATYHFSVWRRWAWTVHYFHRRLVLLLWRLQPWQIHELHWYPVIETFVDWCTTTRITTINMSAFRKPNNQQLAYLKILQAAHYSIKEILHGVLSVEAMLLNVRQKQKWNRTLQVVSNKVSKSWFVCMQPIHCTAMMWLHQTDPNLKIS